MASSDQNDTAAVFGPAARRTGRSRAGGVLVALLIAALIAAGTVALTFMTREEAEPYMLAGLGAFAVLGVFALFAFAVGLVRVGAGAPAAEGGGDGVADHLPEGVVVADAAGHVLYANIAYAMLADLDEASRARAPGPERLLAGDPEAAEPMFRLAAAARTGTFAEEEVRLSHAVGRTSGGPRWYRLSVRPLPGGDGRRLWRVADVTDERRDQESSFQELQSVINFLDHAPAGFFSADAEGRIVYLNATLAEWLGYDLARIEAGRLTLADVVRGDGAAMLSSLVGRPGDVRTETVDIDLVRRSGQSLPVRLLHRVSFGSGGAAGDSRTLVLSRAPGEEAAESLRAAEVRFARFFNNAPIAIAAVDRSGRLGRANAPFLRLFGALANRPQGEARPRLAEAVGERDRAGFASALAAAVAGHAGIAPVEATLAGEGGRSVRFYISPVKDAESAGDDEAAIVYALETTEQRALEMQFTQSQKMQAVGQLAGGVAHDFNNLLTAIIGFADLVLTRYRPSDPFFQDIMAIKQNANRAAGLVRQLLAFSRRQTMRPERIVLNDVLAELTILLDRLLGETVELKVVHGRDLWPVMADVNQLEQVIVNLAVNARDAMPEGGRLSIRTANVPMAESGGYAAHGIPMGDYVLIDIADTGKGMSAEVMEKIFEPFFTTKERGKGTGLGLSTVYGIVKQSGGYITVDSAPGAGTTFRILLPRAAAERVARSLPPIETTAVRAPAEPTVRAPRPAPGEAPPARSTLAEPPAAEPPAPPPARRAEPAAREPAAPSHHAYESAEDVASALVTGSAANRSEPQPFDVSDVPYSGAVRDEPAAADEAPPPRQSWLDLPHRREESGRRRADGPASALVTGSAASRTPTEQVQPEPEPAPEPVVDAAPAPSQRRYTEPEPSIADRADLRTARRPEPTAAALVSGSAASRTPTEQYTPAYEPEPEPEPAPAAAPPREPAYDPAIRRPVPAADAMVTGSAASRSGSYGAEVGADAPRTAPTDLTGNGTILLVEDEDAVRAFATRALVSRGYTVHPAASGAEALKVMEETGGRIDLVVSDVVMPEMDGPSLLRELRRTRPDLKIIFVSGYAEDAFARNLPDNERFSFLPKPFTLKQLATAVKAVLAGEEVREGS